MCVRDAACLTWTDRDCLSLTEDQVTSFKPRPVSQRLNPRLALGLGIPSQAWLMPVYPKACP